jgi:hypothetical protein
MPDDVLLTESDMRQEFSWSIEQFREARLLGFPAACWETTVRARQQRTMPVWPAGTVNNWAKSIRALRLDSGTRRSCARPPST